MSMGKSLTYTAELTMNVVAALLCTAAILSIPAQADSDVMRGSAVAVDGRVLSMNNQELMRDCGKFARLGLTELVVAATIECRKVTQRSYDCKTEDGYDLALGQIHAGWAVPTKSAPEHYFTKMNEAKAKKRMLWSASHADGKPDYASALMDKH